MVFVLVGIYGVHRPKMGSNRGALPPLSGGLCLSNEGARNESLRSHRLVGVKRFLIRKDAQARVPSFLDPDLLHFSFVRSPTPMSSLWNLEGRGWGGGGFFSLFRVHM